VECSHSAYHPPKSASGPNANEVDSGKLDQPGLTLWRIIMRHRSGPCWTGWLHGTSWAAEPQAGLHTKSGISIIL
jgi:hypothetical protein